MQAPAHEGVGDDFRWAAFLPRLFAQGGFFFEQKLQNQCHRVIIAHGGGKKPLNGFA